MTRKEELEIIIFGLQSRLKLPQGIDQFTQPMIDNLVNLTTGLQKAFDEYNNIN